MPQEVVSDLPDIATQKLKVASLVEVLEATGMNFTPMYHSGSLEGASVGDLLNLAREADIGATIEVLEKSAGLSCDEVKDGLIKVYRKVNPEPVASPKIHNQDDVKIESRCCDPGMF